MVAFKFVPDHLNYPGRAIDMQVPGPVQGDAQQLVKANQVIDMAMADEDI